MYSNRCNHLIFEAYLLSEVKLPAKYNIINADLAEFTISNAIERQIRDYIDFDDPETDEFFFYEIDRVDDLIASDISNRLAKMMTPIIIWYLSNQPSLERYIKPISNIEYPRYFMSTSHWPDYAYTDKTKSKLRSDMYAISLNELRSRGLFGTLMDNALQYYHSHASGYPSFGVEYSQINNVIEFDEPVGAFQAFIQALLSIEFGNFKSSYKSFEDMKNAYMVHPTLLTMNKILMEYMRYLDFRSKSDSEAEAAIEGKDFKVVKTYSDGFKWVMLLTNHACTLEGDPKRMRNCLRNYHPERPNNSLIFLSLRNPNNKSVANVQLTNPGKYTGFNSGNRYQITQIKGKANSRISPDSVKYVSDLKHSFQSFNLPTDLPRVPIEYHGSLDFK
jgi:hypothetical protein